MGADLQSPLSISACAKGASKSRSAAFCPSLLLLVLWAHAVKRWVVLILRHIFLPSLLLFWTLILFLSFPQSISRHHFTTGPPVLERYQWFELWCKPSLFAFVKASLDYRLWQWYADRLERVIVFRKERILPAFSRVVLRGLPSLLTLSSLL